MTNQDGNPVPLGLNTDLLDDVYGNTFARLESTKEKC